MKYNRRKCVLARVHRFGWCLFLMMCDLVVGWTPSFAETCKTVGNTNFHWATSTRRHPHTFTNTYKHPFHEDAQLVLPHLHFQEWWTENFLRNVRWVFRVVIEYRKWYRGKLFGATAFMWHIFEYVSIRLYESVGHSVAEDHKEPSDQFSRLSWRVPNYTINVRASEKTDRVVIALRKIVIRNPADPVVNSWLKSRKFDPRHALLWILLVFV